MSVQSVSLTSLYSSSILVNFSIISLAVFIYLNYFLYSFFLAWSLTSFLFSSINIVSIFSQFLIFATNWSNWFSISTSTLPVSPILGVIPPFISFLVLVAIPPFVSSHVLVAIPRFVSSPVLVGIPPFVSSHVLDDIPPFVSSHVLGAIPPFVSSHVSVAIPPFVSSHVPSSISPFVSSHVPSGNSTLSVICLFVDLAFYFFIKNRLELLFFSTMFFFFFF